MGESTSCFAAYNATSMQLSLGGLADWLRFLKPENLAALRELIPALDGFVKAADTKGRVRAGLSLMTIIAKMTPSETDDKLVSMLSGLASDELIDILVNIVSGFANTGPHAASVEAAAKDHATAAAAGVPWQLLVQVALQLFDIIKKFQQPKA